MMIQEFAVHKRISITYICSQNLTTGRSMGEDIKSPLRLCHQVKKGTASRQTLHLLELWGYMEVMELVVPLHVFATLNPPLAKSGVFRDFVQILWVVNFGQVGELPQRFSKSHYYGDFFQKWSPTCDFLKIYKGFSI